MVSVSPASDIHHRSQPFDLQLARIPPMLKLPLVILINIVSYLDYPGTIFLKATCKQPTLTVEAHPLVPPEPSDRFIIRKMYPSKTNFPDSRFPPYYCNQCHLTYPFEHTMIWLFWTYHDYASQFPRMCVLWAVPAGRWISGSAISRKCVLCEKCLNPRHVSRGTCTWNCQRCGTCVRRKFWSGVCVRCWRPADELRKEVPGLMRLLQIRV